MSTAISTNMHSIFLEHLVRDISFFFSAGGFVVVTAIVLLFWGLFAKKEVAHLMPRSLARTGGVLLIIQLLLIIISNPISQHIGSTLPSISFNSFSSFFSILLTSLYAAGLFLSLPFLARDRISSFEFTPLVLFSLFGAWLAILSQNFLLLYIGLELQSLCFYVLVSLRKDRLSSSEAGVKYFILGALASSIILFGIALIYGASGTIFFEGMSSYLALSNPLLVTLGLVFIAGGFAFKISAVPFHMWAPDIYQGSPLPVTLMLATASKVLGFALIIKIFMGPFRNFLPTWHVIFVFMGFASIIAGALLALAQTNMKRFVAYSAIVHTGFLLLTLSVGTASSVSASFLYLIIYVVMAASLLMCLGYLEHKQKTTFDISHLAGLGRVHPWIGFALAAILFSMAGIPPFAGFFAKFFAFAAIIQSGAYALATWGLVASVLSAAYYLWIVKILYFDEPAQEITLASVEFPRWFLVPCLLFILFFFIDPNLLHAIIHSATAPFFTH